MSLFFYQGASGLNDERVRLGPTGFSFTEAADAGTFAMSQVRLDDVDASLDIVGHHTFRAIETACSFDTLFRGYFADRNIKRAGSLRLGVMRIWDCTVYDLNGALQFEVIKGNGGKRPAETDTQRIAWLLGSGYTGPISSSDANVLGYDVDVDKADYRGQTMADVLSDCAQVSGANYFVAWDDTLGATLHYYRPTRAFNSSTLRISNVQTEVNTDTVFAPDEDAYLSKDPSGVFSGLYYGYGEHAAHVFREDASVLASIGHKRETRDEDSSVRTPGRAQAKADRWLTEAQTELDTISVTLRQVPRSKVNLIRAGQRIEVKFTHLPGFTSYTWMRVTRRTVAQDGESQRYYSVGLELANPKQGGSKVRHKPQPVAPDVVDAGSVSYTRKSLEQTIGTDDGHGGTADGTTYGTVPPNRNTIVDAVDYATTYVYANCPFGESGFNGRRVLEQWLEFDPGNLDDVAGVRITYTTTTDLGILLYTQYPLLYGYLLSGPPTAAGQGIILGECSMGGGAFTIPSSVLVPNATNYIFLRAGWQSQPSGMVCSGQLVAGLKGPLGDSMDPGGGEFNSGSLAVTFTSAQLRTVEGSGDIPWSPLLGDVDGTNVTFTMGNWDGTGVPRIRIGGLELAAGSDFTYDDDGVVTLDVAPWPGATLAGRWRV